MKKLPKEFTELNNSVYEFNSNLNNIALFGEGFYLLLQGSRKDGYKLYLLQGEIGKGKVYQVLIAGGANKKQIKDTFDLLDRMALAAMAKANARSSCTNSHPSPVKF